MLFAPAAFAQRPTQGDLEAAAARVDCSQLASQPNATLSVQACEAQKAAYGGLGAAVRTPGGERPGDEAMSCTQVIAEMQSMHFAGVSADTAATGQAAGENLAAVMQARQQAAGAMAARHTAETAAVAMLPNAVQGVVAYQHAAEQTAQGQASVAALKPARDRTAMANAASAQELAANLQANPRFARLMQLVQAKQCQMSDAPSR